MLASVVHSPRRKLWRLAALLAAAGCCFIWGIWSHLSQSKPPVPSPLGGLFRKPAVSQLVQTNHERGPKFPCPAFAFSCRWLDEKSAKELVAALRKDASWKELKQPWAGFQHRTNAYVHFIPVKLAQPRKVLPGIAYEVRVSQPLEGMGFEMRHWWQTMFQP
jgi:hypothetical protein